MPYAVIRHSFDMALVYFSWYSAGAGSGGAAGSPAGRGAPAGAGRPAAAGPRPAAAQSHRLPIPAAHHLRAAPQLHRHLRTDALLRPPALRHGTFDLPPFVTVRSTSRRADCWAGTVPPSRYVRPPALRHGPTMRSSATDGPRRRRSPDRTDRLNS